MGVASPTWFFGEGTTLDPFTEFLTIQSPDPSATSTVALTYQPDRCDGPAPGPITACNSCSTSVDGAT